MAVFNETPNEFIDLNNLFPVLNSSVGLTYEQFRVLVENTFWLKNKSETITNTNTTYIERTITTAQHVWSDHAGDPYISPVIYISGMSKNTDVQVWFSADNNKEIMKDVLKRMKDSNVIVSNNNLIINFTSKPNNNFKIIIAMTPIKTAGKGVFIPTFITPNAQDITYNEELTVAQAIEENTLPNPPDENPEDYYLGWNEDGEKIAKKVVISGGSYKSNIYFSNADSDITGYKKLSNKVDDTITVFEKTAQASTSPKLIEKFLFDLPVNTDVITGGDWFAHINCRVDSVENATRFLFKPFVYHEDGTEKYLFPTVGNSAETSPIKNIAYDWVSAQYTSEQIEVIPTDRIGVEVYITTTRTSPTKLEFRVGDGFASHVNLPLAIRHDDTRGKNDNPGYQHITRGEQSFEGNKTFEDNVEVEGSLIVNGGTVATLIDVNTRQYKIHGSSELTLVVADWVDKEQTISIPINPNNRNEVDVVPEHIEAWANAGIVAMVETETGITFVCKAVPTEDLRFRVVSTEVQYVS